MSGAVDPASVVVDADVLAADVFIDGAARAAMDVLRRHEWIEVSASDRLLDDAVAIIGRLGDDALAEDWRALFEARRTPVDHPAGDHPALATAYAAGAGHVLTLDEQLTTAATGLAMRPAMSVSIRTPGAFLATFDADALQAATADGAEADDDDA